MTDQQPAGTSLLGRAFRPGTQDDDSVALMVRMLDLQDQALPVQRLRDWALDMVQVVPGRKVVDIGSGTGTMTRRLAELAHPGGTVVGVEPNPALRAIATERATNAGTYAEFTDGLAGSLPFADESVDVLWCERVLQHVPDAAAAVVDIARVLKPGGRAVILDSDHGSRVIGSLDPDVGHRVSSVFNSHVLNPYAARRLPRQLVEAGLEVDPDIASAALILGAQGAELVRTAVAASLAEGAVDASEAEAALASFEESLDGGWAFNAVTIFGFVATKPRTAPTEAAADPPQ